MEKYELYYNDVTCGIKPLVECAAKALQGVGDKQAAIHTLMIALNNWDEMDKKMQEAPHA